MHRLIGAHRVRAPVGPAVTAAGKQGHPHGPELLEFCVGTGDVLDRVNSQGGAVRGHGALLGLGPPPAHGNYIGHPILVVHQVVGEGVHPPRAGPVPVLHAQAHPLDVLGVQRRLSVRVGAVKSTKHLLHLLRGQARAVIKLLQVTLVVGGVGLELRGHLNGRGWGGGVVEAVHLTQGLGHHVDVCLSLRGAQSGRPVHRKISDALGHVNGVRKGLRDGVRSEVTDHSVAVVVGVDVELRLEEGLNLLHGSVGNHDGVIADLDALVSSTLHALLHPGHHSLHLLSITCRQLIDLLPGEKLLVLRGVRVAYSLEGSVQLIGACLLYGKDKTGALQRVRPAHLVPRGRQHLPIVHHDSITTSPGQNRECRKLNTHGCRNEASLG
mmetsp:Transcript_10544/g.23243  ORF Transcript_10544/g.23243 Transcript_10544/m.23243 type:complete len:382 (-) Transcript_10544:40-1185(-)